MAGQSRYNIAFLCARTAWQILLIHAIFITFVTPAMLLMTMGNLQHALMRMNACTAGRCTSYLMEFQAVLITFVCLGIMFVAFMQVSTV